MSSKAQSISWESPFKAVSNKVHNNRPNLLLLKNFQSMRLFKIFQLLLFDFEGIPDSSPQQPMFQLYATFSFNMWYS
jgi:hypothetical protein